MEIETALMQIVDLVDVFKDHFTPAQVAGMLIAQGASIAFYCAPSVEEAKQVIEMTVRHAHADFINQ